MIGRFANDDLRLTSGLAEGSSIVNRHSQILLLPGSRKSELQRHLPVMLGALDLIQSQLPEVRAKMVLPNIELKRELVGPMNQTSKELARRGRKIGLNSMPSADRNSPHNI